MGVKDILIRIKGNSKSFEKSIDKSEKSMGTFSQKMKKHSGAIKAGLVGVSVAAVAVGAKMFKSTVETGVGLDKMSKQTGITVESLGRLKYALDQEHGSMEVFKVGMKRLAKSMYDADTGLAESVRTFEALNISIYNTDGSLRSVDDMMLETADIFKGMTDDTKKAALAQELFGRSGMEMIPFLEMGREGIEALGDEAEELGIVMSGTTAREMKAFDDEMTKLKGGLKGVSMQVGTMLLPIMGELLEMLIWATKYVFPPIVYAFGLLLIPIRQIINSFKILIGTAEAAWMALDGDISGAKTKMNEMIQLQKDFTAEIMKTVKNIEDEKTAMEDVPVPTSEDDVDIPPAEKTAPGYARSAAMTAAAKGVSASEFAGKETDWRDIKSKDIEKETKAYQDEMLSIESTANAKRDAAQITFDNMLNGIYQTNQYLSRLRRSRYRRRGS